MSVIVRRSRRPRIGVLVSYGVLSGLALVFLVPFVLVLSVALQRESDVFVWPPHIIPPHPTLSNLPNAINAIGLVRAFINSTVVSVTSTVLTVLFSSSAGYAFARLRFKGRNLVFMVFMSTIMMPTQLIMVPLYIMLVHVPLVGDNDITGSGGHGLLNSYPGLILPIAVGVLYVFLFRQYFLSLPKEYGEQARIDGCSEFGIFWRIYLPLAKPVVATVAILAFLNAWNDLIWPLVSTSTQDMRTLQVAILAYRYDDVNSMYSLLMAGNLISFIVPVLLFAVFQRHLVSGIAAGGLKA